MQIVNKLDAFPPSCATLCEKKEGCIGANEILGSDMCQLLEEDDEIPGLEWYDSPGYNIWSFEKPCPKVQYCHAVKYLIKYTVL